MDILNTFQKLENQLASDNDKIKSLAQEQIREQQRVHFVAQGRETVSKNRVTSRKTTGVGVNFVQRFAAAIFCLALALNAFAYDFSAVNNGKTIYYNITSSSAPYTAEVTFLLHGYGNENAFAYLGNVVIPSTVTYSGKTYSVTTIGNYAFLLCRNLTSVTIPNSVTTIGNEAFSYCEGLTSVTIPESVTSIGQGAFSACYGLTTVNYNAINCDISSSEAHTIFSTASDVLTLNIGSNVTKIPTLGTFYGFTSINADQNNPNYSSLNGVLFNKDKTTLIMYPTGKTQQSYTIPNSVTTIGDAAFACCESLTSVTIGNYVTTIGNYAFEDCRGLTSVTIPNSVTTIGYRAFQYCEGLTSVTIGNSVTTIGNSAFQYCSGLTSVAIPNSVTTIGYRAFQYCSGLTSVAIPNSVTTISDEAFGVCTGLTSVTIGNSVMTIGYGAFWYCEGLTSVTIPNSVTTIGHSAFMYCTNLKEFTIADGTNTLDFGNSVCYYCPLETVYLGRNISYDTSSYDKSPFFQKTTIKELVIGNSVTSIGNYAFYGCTSLKELIIADGTNTLDFGNRVYSSCPLETVYLGRNISCDTEYYSPFSSEPTLKEVVIGNLVTTIGNSAFSYCSGLTSVTIPNSVTTIGNYAFINCIGLTSVTIPNSVTTIGNYAFYGCRGLTSITIPNSIATIGEFAFFNCSGLKDVTVNWDTPISINHNVFSFYGNLHIPVSTRCAYVNADFWKNFNIVGGWQLQTIDFSEITIKTYGDGNITLAQNSSADLAVTYTSDNEDVATISGNTVVLHNAGTANIRAIQNGNNCYAPDTVTQILTVNKAPLTVIADNKSRRVGEPNPALTYSISGFKNGETQSVIDVLPTVTTTATQASGAGSYPIIASGASDNNYSFTYQNGTLTVNDLETQTIIFNPLPAKAYGDASFTLSASASSGLPVSYSSSNTNVATVSGNTVTIIGAGEANITASQAGNAEYTPAMPVTQKLTVGKAPLAVTADSKSRKYGEANPALTYAISGFKNSETQSVIDVLPTITTTATQTSTCGTYAITVSGASDNNYNFVYTSGNLSITKAPLTVTAENKSRKYGEANPNLTYLISGFKNGETQSVIDVLPNAATAATQTSNAGSYAITVSGASDNDYDFTYQNGNLNITKAGLTVIADNKFRRVGEPNPALTYSISGFKNGETQSVIDVLPTVTTTATQASGAGSYPITASGASDNNYDFTYQNGTLTVNNLETQTIIFNPLPAKTYGDASFTLSASANSGLPVTFGSNNTAVATVSGNTITIVGAGVASITASQAGNAVYSPATVSQTLTVGKAPLTITADNKTRPQAQPNPAFTLSYNGFKNADNPSVLDALPVISCSANETSPAGFYNIVLSGGSDNNYAYTLVSGRLEVTAVAPATYSITASVTGAGGIISPEGHVTVNAGSNKTFVFTPDKNYQIRLVLVDEIPNAQAKGNGYYTFTNIADNHTISVMFETTTGIEDVVAAQLSVYPNPVREELFIQSEMPVKRVEIYTLAGVLLMQENNFTGKLSVPALPSGVYLLKIYSEKGIEVRKLVKE